MQLPHDATAAARRPFLPRQLRPERPFIGALPEPQQADENVLLGILIRQERLPAPVRRVIAPQKLDGFWTDFVMNLMDLKPNEINFSPQAESDSKVRKSQKVERRRL